jgi:lipoate-protein ligase A
VLDLGRCAADGVPVVVRPTGGRAVYHDAEWTYAALVPLAHPVLGGSLGHSCRSVVAWVAAALHDAFGVTADAEPAAHGPAVYDAAGGARALVRDACFVRSYGYELCVGGRKLMGSAQRRGRVALLQQGSLLTGPGQERLARYLRGPAVEGGGAPGEDPGAEARRAAALASVTTHLAALLGRAPEYGAFERAFRAHAGRIEAASARLW